MKTYNSQIIKENTIETLEDRAIFLLSQKGSDKITVSDLCREAGVSRQTFYKYFDSYEDVLYSFLKKKFQLIYAEVLDSLDKEDGTRMMLEAIFKGIYQDKEIFKVIFEKEAILMLKLSEDWAEQIDDHRIMLRDFEKEFYVGVFFEISRHWVIHGCIVPLEDIVEFMERKLF